MAQVISLSQARFKKQLAAVRLQEAKRPTKAKRQAQKRYEVRIAARAAL